jgi:hypothetical protein
MCTYLLKLILFHILHSIHSQLKLSLVTKIKFNKPILSLHHIYISVLAETLMSKIKKPGGKVRPARRADNLAAIY